MLFEVFQRILRISKDEFCDDFGPTQIEAWDSIAHLELVSELEDSYNIEFAIDDISKMRTIGDIKTILTNYGIDLNESNKQ